MTLDEVIKQHVIKTLIDLKGNRSATARELDVDRRSLYRMLHRWGITVEKSVMGCRVASTHPLESLDSNGTHDEGR